MEPGTYKDRLLMEQLPLLVEDMLISAFALKRCRYIFLQRSLRNGCTSAPITRLPNKPGAVAGENIMGTQVRLLNCLSPGQGYIWVKKRR